jgi:hypothetical protein
LDDVNRPVTVGGKDYGVLRLEYDADQVAEDLWSISVLVLGAVLVQLVPVLVLTANPARPAQARKPVGFATSKEPSDERSIAQFLGVLGTRGNF